MGPASFCGFALTEIIPPSARPSALLWNRRLAEESRIRCYFCVLWASICIWSQVDIHHVESMFLEILIGIVF